MVRLDEVAREAVLRFLPRADAMGVDLGALGMDVPAPVRGDATLIDGILNNLLDNALRYGTDNQRGAPAVTVAIEQTSHQTVLSIQDNGSGLPGEVQRQLMRARRTGRSRGVAGRGRRPRAGAGGAVCATDECADDAGQRAGWRRLGVPGVVSAAARRHTLTGAGSNSCAACATRTQSLMCSSPR